MGERDDKVEEIARQMSQNASFAGFDHAWRVTQIALDIGEREGADLEVLRIAGLLHDIGVPLDKPRHYEIGAFLARGILKELGYGEKFVDRVAKVIETHSRYGGPDPETLEGKILQDADAVEYVGAVGLVRGIVRALEAGRYRGDVNQIPSLIDDLVAQISGNLHTERAKELVRERIEFLEGFKQRILEELNGEK